MSKRLTIRRAAAVSAVAAASLATGAGPALARQMPRTARASPGSHRADGLFGNTCASQGTDAAVFSRWGDPDQYWLVAGSTFAGSAPGWTLAGGAAPTSGGDPFGLTGTPSTGSLSLPAGASATSPWICVDATQPTFRFLDAATTTGAQLSVSVVYQSVMGLTTTLPVATVGAAGWQPTPVLQDGAQIASILGGGTASMAVRVTAVQGTSRIDDLYVDPRMGWHS